MDMTFRAAADATPAFNTVLASADATSEAAIETFAITTSAGPLTYHVASPATVRPGLTPLVALHGISREAEAVVEGFADHAAREGRVVIAPHFAADQWSVFQRPTRKTRPDIALLEVLDEARLFGLISGRQVNLFGYSGGGQLAHRFAMLYPHRVATLHVGAAGWYCMPDDAVAYPYGVGWGGERDHGWSARARANLGLFLELPISVYVGENDDNPSDAALRRNRALDAAQGVHRRARAAAYVDGLNRAARRPIAELVELQRCGHSFPDCVRTGGLAGHVLNRSL